MNQTIRKITIINGTRIASVQGVSHGLGPVGEPLRLGHRSEGYTLVLPDDLNEVRVFYVDTDKPADSRGYYPKREVPWSWLGDPERPTRD